MPSTVYHVYVLMLTNSDTTILLEHWRIELLCAWITTLKKRITYCKRLHSRQCQSAITPLHGSNVTFDHSAVRLLVVCICFCLLAGLRVRSFSLLHLQAFFSLSTLPLVSNRFGKFSTLIGSMWLCLWCWALVELIIIIISNGNRTEWSPIRSVIIRVINKIGRLRSGSPICLIMSMITDRIGWHEDLCYQLIITLTKFVT